MFDSLDPKTLQNYSIAAVVLATIFMVFGYYGIGWFLGLAGFFGFVYSRMLEK